MKRRVHALILSMRPEQWVKNLFVLAPLLFGRKLGEPASVLDALLATAVFCLMSSALYLLNDVLDAAEDRSHPVKHLRPIASGELSARLALMAFAVLLAVSVWLAHSVNGEFLAISLVYAALMAAYSLGLKRVLVLDAMMIAAGFVLRVAGGAAAVEVPPSHWLVVCAFLLALYLAFGKRRQELLALPDSASIHRHVLGQYTPDYLKQVNNILLGATIVCYALYTVAPDTVSRFGTDRLLYGTAFVIYGLLRYMALTQGESEGDNPGKLLLGDKPLLVAILGWAIYNAWIIYEPSMPGLWRQ